LLISRSRTAARRSRPHRSRAARRLVIGDGSRPPSIATVTSWPSGSIIARWRRPAVRPCTTKVTITRLEMHRKPTVPFARSLRNCTLPRSTVQRARARSPAACATAARRLSQPARTVRSTPPGGTCIPAIFATSRSRRRAMAVRRSRHPCASARRLDADGCPENGPALAAGADDAVHPLANTRRGATSGGGGSARCFMRQAEAAGRLPPRGRSPPKTPRHPQLTATAGGLRGLGRTADGQRFARVVLPASPAAARARRASAQIVSGSARAQTPAIAGVGGRRDRRWGRSSGDSRRTTLAFCRHVPPFLPFLPYFAVITKWPRRFKPAASLSSGRRVTPCPG
jgi:hypothetical protein